MLIVSLWNTSVIGSSTETAMYFKGTVNLVALLKQAFAIAHWSLFCYSEIEEYADTCI